MAKIIMHIDLNAFFVTCEEIRDPSLIGKPVMIGHAGRSGIVSTCSYAARKYGVHSGQPTFQAQKLCPNLIIIPGDYSYYSLMSDSFYVYLKRYSEIIERASIDECFVDMSKAMMGEKDPEGFLRRLQNGLKEETGLSCSIGIAPTKWLAKMASDMKKPMGLTFLRKRDIPTLLYPLPIESFWGIGKKTAPRLRGKGIKTIGDLAAFLEKEDAEKEFGKFYYTLKQWLNGTSSDVVEVEEEDPKSIGNSETLMHDEDSELDVAPVIKRLSYEVAGRAKSQGLIGQTITLQVKDAHYDEQGETFHLKNKSVSFKEGTNDGDFLYERCLELYRANFLGMPIRLVGVSLSKLKNPVTETVQMSFWNYEDYEERDKTKLLINEINRKLDKPALTRASKLKKGNKNGNR
ncbi:MAG: DNA polymerase IV [Bacilli bacterium]|nr:DNA polymerase IV [Bacilli bacterium]